jgi:hypothetical protein
MNTVLAVDTNNYFRTVTVSWQTTDEQVEAIQNMYEPEWAIYPAVITERAGKKFIVWARDLSKRPYLP